MQIHESPWSSDYNLIIVVCKILRQPRRENELRIEPTIYFCLFVF